MIKTTIATLFLMLTMSVHAEPEVELLYSDLKVKLPGQFTLIGDVGGEDNILIIRYGSDKGKNYIAFTDMTNDKSLDYGCPIKVFFDDLFSGDDSTCNAENLSIMRETFIDNKDVELWQVGGYTVRYSGGKDKSFAFISAEDGKLVKVDSDFLKKERYKTLLGDL